MTCTDVRSVTESTVTFDPGRDCDFDDIETRVYTRVRTKGTDGVFVGVEYKIMVISSCPWTWDPWL